MTRHMLSAQCLRVLQRCTVGSLLIWVSVKLKVHHLPSWWWDHAGRAELRGSKNIALCKWPANSTCHCHLWRRGIGCLSLVCGHFRLPTTEIPLCSPLRYIVVLGRGTSQIPSCLGMEAQSFHHAALASIKSWFKTASWLEFQLLKKISCTLLWFHQQYPLRIARLIHPASKGVLQKESGKNEDKK